LNKNLVLDKVPSRTQTTNVGEDGGENLYTVGGNIN
jgi:hypothetical protein